VKKIPAFKKVPILFSVLCFALAALMAFQIMWLFKSKRLIEEQFDQKVNMAIGGALTEFNKRHQTTLDPKDLKGCRSDESYMCLPRTHISNTERLELEESLQGYMACYGIDEKYSVEILESSCTKPKSSYSCSIGGPAGDDGGSYLGVSFVGREDYLYDQMSPMILSSVVIFILLASVSFIILGALIKQKRITANNIDFFNNTAHELKTPLTNISLALKLLGKKHPGIEGDKYAEILKAENSRLSEQIERVLFLSKMENGEYTLEKEELDIKEVLQEVVEAMSLAVIEKEGSIELDLAAEDLKISGDRFHLGNVFRNLIDNAIKYCEKEPQIKISVKESNKHVQVTFSDNGIGISPQDQNHIFEKFQRVNTGNVRSTKGFGLGLSYVKTVIELHKGLVQVKSELNKGSQFHLLIPNA